MVNVYMNMRGMEEVERPQRKATIYSFERTSEPIFNESAQTQSWRFKVVCGKEPMCGHYPWILAKN